MTNYAANQSGNWSNSAIWTPTGVPGTGDTVQIQYAVTVDVDTIVGNSPASLQWSTSAPYGNAISVFNCYQALLGGHTNNGALTIAAGVSLTVRGDMVAYQGTITLNPGSVLQFDSSLSASPSTTYYLLDIQTGMNWTGDPRTGILTINGTAGNRGVVQTVGGGMCARIGSGYKPLGIAPTTQQGRACGIINAVYAKFYLIGDASNVAMSPWFESTAPAYSFSLHHVEFNTCGILAPYQQCDANASVDLQNVTFKNSQGNLSAQNIGGLALMSSGTRNVINCVFDKYVEMQACSSFVITGNVFLDTYQQTGAPFTGALVQGNFIGNTSHVNTNGDITAYASSGAKTLMYPMLAYGMNFNNNYCCVDQPWYAASKFLFMDLNSGSDPLVISNNIAEFTGTDPNGEFILLSPPYTGGSRSNSPVTITGNIILPNAANSQSFTLLTDFSAGSTSNVSVEHNVVVCDASNKGGIALNESTAAIAGMVGEYLSIRSNIFWDYAANARAGTSYACWDENPSTVTADQIVLNKLDYNCHFHTKTGSVTLAGNTASLTGYSGFHFSGGNPGAHDRTGNPGFVDPTRNLAKFDLAVLGGPGTAAHGYGQLALLNDDTGFNPLATVDNLITYVRAGFMPTNPILIRGGHDSNTIGAVQPNAPYASLIMA